MSQISQIRNFIARHPLTRDHKTRALIRFIKWQVSCRLQREGVEVSWIKPAKLWVKKGMNGATGNIYTGLHEFEDMSFLLHYLPRDEVFVDVGANVGTFTILAAVVVNAQVIAVEPVDESFRALTRNVQLNSCEKNVRAVKCALGSEHGTVSMTDDLDTRNRISSGEKESESHLFETDLETLDSLVNSDIPSLIKIDVEGFEWDVLKGAEQVLGNSALNAVIIELNGSGEVYGHSDDSVHALLLRYGFKPYRYDPFSRSLAEYQKDHAQGDNRIYIRDHALVEARLRSAKPFTVLGRQI